MMPFESRDARPNHSAPRVRSAVGATVPILPLLALLAWSGCEGDPGPMGPQGAPGDTARGASYVARFDRMEDLDSWQYGITGTWQIQGGALVVAAERNERVLIGPSSTFSGDVDISVSAAWVRRVGDVTLGLRFHAGTEGAYALTVSGEGTYSLSLEEEGGTTQLIDWPAAPSLRPDSPNELRAVVRGANIRLYINGSLVNEAMSTALDAGLVQLFVGGSAEAAFDNLWVSTALPLL